MKKVQLIEYSDLWMMEYILSKAKVLYKGAKIESSQQPIKYTEDGEPIYGIRITQYV